MLTKQITYTDYNDEQITETFYFNLSKAEIAEMQLTHPGGYAEYLQRIIESKDQAQLVKAFKDLIMIAYGVKSEDGKHFRKSEELSKDFEQSEAYSELFMELLSSADAAAAFVNGIMPAFDLKEKKKADIAARTKSLIEERSSQE